jgi:hypothetical protein
VIPLLLSAGLALEPVPTERALLGDGAESRATLYAPALQLGAAAPAAGWRLGGRASAAPDLLGASGLVGLDLEAARPLELGKLELSLGGTAGVRWATGDRWQSHLRVSAPVGLGAGRWALAWEPALTLPLLDEEQALPGETLRLRVPAALNPLAVSLRVRWGG